MKIVELDQSSYASVPMHISGDSIYRLKRPEPFTFILEKEACDAFSFEVSEENPENWKSFISLDNFKLVGIYQDATLVAAMSLVHDNPSVRMLDGRKDVLLVWDLRVHPDHKGKGYGRALIDYARHEAEALGVNHLRIETQNTNPSAVDFYHNMGFELAQIREHAYSGQMSEDAGGKREIMLIFNEKLEA